MTKNRKNLRLRVLFNASVVLSGLRSPDGGSGRLLTYIKKRVIVGKISEIIFDEILRHSMKLGLTTSMAANLNLQIFDTILPSPSEKIVNRYKKVIIDEGDAHILATCEEEKIKCLVTLDRKHLLVLKGKIKGLKILTPGELIKYISLND